MSDLRCSVRFEVASHGDSCFHDGSICVIAASWALCQLYIISEETCGFLGWADYQEMELGEGKLSINGVCQLVIFFLVPNSSFCICDAR